MLKRIFEIVITSTLLLANDTLLAQVNENKLNSLLGVWVNESLYEHFKNPRSVLPSKNSLHPFMSVSFLDIKNDELSAVIPFGYDRNDLFKFVFKTGADNKYRSKIKLRWLCTEDTDSSLTEINQKAIDDGIHPELTLVVSNDFHKIVITYVLEKKPITTVFVKINKKPETLAERYNALDYIYSNTFLSGTYNLGIISKNNSNQNSKTVKFEGNNVNGLKDYDRYSVGFPGYNFLIDTTGQIYIPVYFGLDKQVDSKKNEIWSEFALIKKPNETLLYSYRFLHENKVDTIIIEKLKYRFLPVK